MAKNTSKKDASKTVKKTPAAYSSTDGDSITPASDNESKYQPTEDAEMNMQSLDPEDGLLKLFSDSIKDIYWAENHLIKALPRMAKAAATKSLSTAILDHLEETKNHSKRLEE